MFRNKRGNKMTDEEKAEEYAENEQCAYCSNPQYCQGKDECYDFSNDDGDIIGHDIGEAKAKALAAEMQEKEPDAGREAMNGDDE